MSAKHHDRPDDRVNRNPDGPRGSDTAPVAGAASGKPSVDRSRSHHGRFSLAAGLNVILAAVAVISLVVGIWHYERNSETQLELMALTNLQNYLQLAVQHPDLASPGDDRTVDARYGWFAGYALTTASTLHDLVGHEASWRRAIDAIVRQHRAYLRSGEFVCADFRPEFVAYVRDRVDGVQCHPVDSLR